MFLLPCGLGLYAQDEGSKKINPVSLCEVLSHPAAYVGNNVTVTVRILSTKEGASLWNPDCRRLGVWLRIEPDARTGPGIAELGQALALHGLGDHPVIATLTGVFDPNHYDDIAHQKRPVFRAIAAKDITRSRNVERR
jgi:hypothetical protein